MNRVNQVLPRSTGSEQQICVVDVGGAGGLQPHWRPYADRIIPILFEPNPVEADKIRRELRSTYDQSGVIETGLSHVTGPRQLNITQHWGCSSLRTPDESLLARYRIGHAFTVLKQEAISCTRYDALFAAGQVPQPDCIKIDVQGFEYEVLLGFSGLLEECLGIEVEAHLYPIYREQKLFHDLVALLSDFGFVVRRIMPVGSFDGDVVELDAWFTKDISHWRRYSASQREKFSILCKVWDLIDYSRIDPADPHNKVTPVEL